MTQGNLTDEEVADLIRRTTEAASALIRGDIRTYLMLIRHADNYTLMAPSGGEPRRGFDASDQALDAMARYFRGGGRRSWRSSSHTPPATWWCWWRSNGNTARSAGCRTRTGRCA